MQLRCIKREREREKEITSDIDIKMANCLPRAADVQINSICAKVANTDKLVM